MFWIRGPATDNSRSHDQTPNCNQTHRSTCAFCFTSLLWGIRLVGVSFAVSFPAARSARGCALGRAGPVVVEQFCRRIQELPSIEVEGGLSHGLRPQMTNPRETWARKCGTTPLTSTRSPGPGYHAPQKKARALIPYPYAWLPRRCRDPSGLTHPWVSFL